MRVKAVILGVVIVVGAIAIWFGWPRAVETPLTPTVSVASSDQAPPRADRIGESVRASSEALVMLMAGTREGVSMSVEERTRRAQGLFDQVRAVDRLLPRETFDLDAVAAQVGRDPGTLHQWVRARTVSVPYRGSLRGARGTLMDRAGNSLDRALLLASMLRASGVTARLARAQLTSDQAGDLRQQPGVMPTTEAPPASVTEGVFGAIDAYAKHTGSDASRIRQQLQQTMDLSSGAVENVRRRVATQTAMLVKGLGIAAPQSPGDSTSEEIQALQDHWWVQWQNGPAWTDLDPDVPDAGAAIAPAQETVDPDALSADLHHAVQVRVIVEQWDGSNLREQRAVSVDLRPSQAWGETLRLQHMPMAWPQNLGGPAEVVGRFKAAALNQHEWLPVFTIGGKRITQTSILDTGDLNTRPGVKAAASPAGGLFDAFGGGETAAPSGVLTAEWIEYEIRSPGQTPRIVRREVFDLVGGDARAARRAPPTLTDPLRLSRALSLLTETEILPLSCQLSSAFVAHLTASRFLSYESLLASAMRGQASPDQLKSVQALPGPLYALAVARAEWSRTPGSVHLRQTNVLSRHTFPRVDANGGVGIVTAIDIVANEVAGHGAAQSERFMARLEQGVLDTNLEAVLIGPGANGDTTADLFGLSDAGARWVAVRTDQDLSKLAQTPDTRARIEADLRAGFVVLARSEAGSAGTEVGWWRVDPRTGDTLSFGHRGWGQAMTEYIVAASVGVFSLCALGASLDGRLSFREGMICLTAGAVASTGVGMAMAAGPGTGLLLGVGFFASMVEGFVGVQFALMPE